MPYIYVSKVNFNSKIYDVYDKKMELSKVLDDVFENIDNGKIYKRKFYCKYEDRYGIEQKKQVSEEYLFNDLQKDFDEKVITGELVRIFPIYTEKFNKELGKSKLIKNEDSSKIYFYFDLHNELIGFCTRNKFGYNQFNDAFKNLIELNVETFGFEVFLKKDKGKVEEGLKRFKRIDKITATLIPPNANNDDVDDLIEDSAEYKEANIKKIKLEYDSSDRDESGICAESDIIKNLIKSVTNGYGDLNVKGVGLDNSNEVFKSNKDAAVTTIIEGEHTEKEFKNKVKLFINKLIAKKV